MVHCAIHGFENCPYHGGVQRTPVGAFRFCACSTDHDGKSPCDCNCGQCQVYREELAAGPVASETPQVAAVAVSHPPDGCAELCGPRDRWVSQLKQIDTAASRSMVRELGAASTDVAVRAANEKAELVYFGELDRLASQRAAGPTPPRQGTKRRKKKSERGKPKPKCALCDVTHPRSFHLNEPAPGSQTAAEAVVRDALDLLGDQPDREGG